MVGESMGDSSWGRITERSGRSVGISCAARRHMDAMLGSAARRRRVDRREVYYSSVAVGVWRCGPARSGLYLEQSTGG